MYIAPPSLPLEPISRPEYNRRIKAAGLMMAPEAFDYSPLQAWTCLSFGTLKILPKEVGGYRFANSPLVFSTVVLEAPQSLQTLASLTPDESWGWEELDSESRDEVYRRLQILFSPSEISLPDPGKAGVVIRGQAVRIVAGPDRGVQGEAFWVGPSKFGDGDRVGIKACDGKKYWTDAESVAPVEDEGPYWTPLHQACWTGDFERVAALLDRFPQWVNAPCGDRGKPETSISMPRFRNGMRPLHVAARIHSLEMVELLLKAGADPNARDEAGTAPLHLVAIHRGKMRRQLLEAGADVNASDKRGQTYVAMYVKPGKLNKADSRELARGLLPELAARGADLSDLAAMAKAERNYILVEALAELGYTVPTSLDDDGVDAPCPEPTDFKELTTLDWFAGQAWLKKRNSPGMSAALLEATPALKLKKGGAGEAFGILDVLDWLEVNGGPVDCPWLVGLLDHQDLEIVRKAALVLRIHDRQAARREAQKRLASSDATVRSLAVEQLGEIGDPETLSALRDLEKSEKNNRVRRALKQTLRLFEQ